MDYAAFRALRAPLEARHDAASLAFKSVPGISSGKMGLTPDDVKASPLFRAVNAEWIAADNAIRAFDRAFTKAHRKTWPVYFKKEIRAERDARRAGGRI
jgi:hypothetical protein